MNIDNNMGTSKNWILINFIEKPFFNQCMSVFAMKFLVFSEKIIDFVFEYFNIQSQAWMKLSFLLVPQIVSLYFRIKTNIQQRHYTILTLSVVQTWIGCR